jgi:hypothetical protein
MPDTITETAEYLAVIYMQCMATAMTAGTGVSGTRAYIARKHFAWVTP